MICIDRVHASQVCEFTKGVAVNGWAKSLVHALHKLVPSQGSTGILLESIVPLLSHPHHIERRRPDFLIFQRSLGMKELLGLVEPAEHVFCAIVLQEAELVDGSWPFGSGRLIDEKCPCFSSTNV